ncbi:hypothetical protein [Pseudomonas sp. RIT-PI-r]|uniref:hypothetical protein n=1 Tax=Pseudomonas sp. RIT-PI-r TaxID=1699620 RepID=UPI0007DAB644|nr:hypothetical protein [Pseudomonas sp. RIT-PI-r]
MGRVLAVLGIVLTFGYLIFIWWLVGERISSLQTMDLNEVGDFLAGAFGPLAILWLVLGFFQQGAELRQSTEALKLQAEELKESVLQQAELAKATNQSLRNYELSLEPVFNFYFGGVEEEFFEGDLYINNNFVLHNSGARCEHVYVCVMRKDGTEIGADRYPLTEAGGRYPLRIVDVLSENDSHEVRVAYVKASGLSGTQIFDFEKVRTHDDEDGWYVNIAKRILPV